jgi:hypothetical protein
LALDPISSSVAAITPLSTFTGGPF